MFQLTKVLSVSSAKCFECQGEGQIASQYSTKRNMLMEKNKVINKEEDENYDKDFEIEEGEIYIGKLLMVKRMLEIQVKEEDAP